MSILKQSSNDKKKPNYMNYKTNNPIFFSFISDFVTKLNLSAQHSLKYLINTKFPHHV